ncbi:MAG: cytochrome c oxidase accessory protein CcoG, partial [Flavobacterium johnsoniae]
KGYASVLLILTGIFIGLLFLRNDVEATILRLPGQLFEHKGENISNVYTYKIVNKTVHNLDDIHFELLSPKGTIKTVGKAWFTIDKEGMAQGTLFVEIHPAFLEGDRTSIEIGVYQGGKLIETERTNFLGPRSFN